MGLNMHGIVRGKQIELECETGLPDGAAVSVQIERQVRSLDDVHKQLDALCGAWSSDESIESVFAELQRHRSECVV